MKKARSNEQRGLVCFMKLPQICLRPMLWRTQAGCLHEHLATNMTTLKDRIQLPCSHVSSDPLLWRSRGGAPVICASSCLSLSGSLSTSTSPSSSLSPDPTVIGGGSTMAGRAHALSSLPSHPGHTDQTSHDKAETIFVLKASSASIANTPSCTSQEEAGRTSKEVIRGSSESGEWICVQ